RGARGAAGLVLVCLCLLVPNRASGRHSQTWRSDGDSEIARTSRQLRSLGEGRPLVVLDHDRARAFYAGGSHRTLLFDDAPPTTSFPEYLRVMGVDVVVLTPLAEKHPRLVED